MQNVNLDFEAINAHVEANYSETAAPKSGSLTKELANSRLCVIYKVVRPILSVISKLPIIPRKWRSVIEELINVLDVLCP
ncbi:MAG: hypothetical protein AAFP77_07500 [Bacteroidota bacterium]